jgi:DNA (cytosine-5)-methyltransferase 3A
MARFTYINSALVSAQNRQRFYVTNFGDIEQPEDRGILLKDILEAGQPRSEKSPCIDANYYKGGNLSNLEKQSGERLQVAEPVKHGNPRCLLKNFKTNEEKSNTLTASSYKGIGNDGMITVAESVCVAQRGRYEDTGNRSTKGEGGTEQFYEARTDGKTNTLTTVQKDNAVAEPVRVGDLPNQEGKISGSQATRIYVIEGAKTGLYAIPVEFEDSIPTKAVSCADGKTYPVYKVVDGLITIKGKEYPIKLSDGYYIIRKLTVRECARLQTMPDDYCKAVSAAQGYKGLGNGWTAEVIIHLLNHALKDVSRDEEIVVLSMYDGIGTGRYCLEKMGFTNVKYHAYEIDKYPMAIANDNYPDIIQHGDAFAVREDDWKAPQPRTDHFAQVCQELERRQK